MRVGPQTVPRDRFDYGAAVKRSWQEQLLVNLVRLRYLDTPVFLDVDQIVAQYTLNGAVSMSTGLVKPWLRRSRRTLMPSRPGSIRSRMITSGDPVVAR